MKSLTESSPHETVRHKLNSKGKHNTQSSLPRESIDSVTTSFASQCTCCRIGPGGGPRLTRLSEISCTYDPPIYDITSGCRVAALFSREAPRWTPDAIWFSRYFYLQAYGIMYLECREY